MFVCILCRMHISGSSTLRYKGTNLNIHLSFALYTLDAKNDRQKNLNNVMNVGKSQSFLASMLPSNWIQVQFECILCNE